MKLTCPRCNKAYNYAIDQIMGCLVKCESCRRVFPWKETAYSIKRNKDRNADDRVMQKDTALPIRRMKMCSDR